jgi:hypothetical protein
MAETPADEPLRWIKSSRSAANGNCVEMAWPVAGAVVALRDSKDPQGTVLRFTGDAWSSFISEVKAGTYDSPEGP